MRSSHNADSFVSFATSINSSSELSEHQTKGSSLSWVPASTSRVLWISLEEKAKHHKHLIITAELSLLGDFDQLFDLFVVQDASLGLPNHHDFDIFVSGLHHVQEGLHYQLQAFLVVESFLVVLLQKLADLLWVTTAALSAPLWERTRGIGIV